MAKAPAGLGLIYLIEYLSNDQEDPILIGHHGIMPIRFSNGGCDLIGGKTENTMVDPEYRSKFLYPRYESRFKKDYSKVCHVLFSTMGPKEAIRQRTAHGYKEVGEWKNLILSTRRALFAPAVHEFIGSDDTKYCLVQLDASTSESIPFDDFWQKCRSMYPLTNSRALKDIQWRFIDNPYQKYLWVFFGINQTRMKLKGMLSLGFRRETDQLQ